MIEKMPTASGSRAATIEPNTHTSSTRVIGMAIISAIQQVSLDRVGDLGVDDREAAGAGR